MKIMKKWSVKLSYPSGEIRETWINAETKEEAGQKFFRRKDGAAMLGEGKVEVEITEAIDSPSAKDYTREILIGLCEDAMTTMKHWHNRDSYSAHSQLGIAYAMLKCDVPFRIEKCDASVIWVEFFDIEGFQYHECGAEEGGYETDSRYISTRYRIEEADSKDWY
jgi:hypothetical protein